MGAYEKAANDLHLVDSISGDNRVLSLTQYLDYKKAVNLYHLERHHEATNQFLKNINDSLVGLNPYLYYNYEYLAENYKKLNLWDSAFHYHMILHDMDNTGKLHESKQNMEALKTQYETGKKEATILAQNQVITQQRIIQWLAVGLAGLLGLFLFQARKNAKTKHEANKKLLELDTLKTRLYANITHEFRTPLTVIGGMVEQVRENPKERLDQGLQMIQRNSDRLLELVNQMLDLSKLENGKVNIQKQQGDIVAYLRYIVESFQSFAESKEIKIYFHSDLEEFVMDFDAEKIQRIIINLLSNAVKFTPAAGKVFVTVGKLISKASRAQEQQLQIQIKDTGKGIPKDQLEYIFDRFHQLDDSNTREQEGTGIGLALVKELVKLLEGHISVKSNSTLNHKDQGTEFTLLFPVSNKVSNVLSPDKLNKYKAPIKLDTSDLNSYLEKEGGDLPLEVHKPKVLLVEDNLDVITYIVSCLEDQYEIVVAKNGEEGIETAIANTPELIITDVMMPIKDGYEVCHTLKSDERTNHIPIIMLTAKADVDSKLKGLEKGADVYLSKPFNKKELLLRINKLLELRKKLQSYYFSLMASGNEVSVVGEKTIAPKEENQFVVKLKTLVESNLGNFDLNLEFICKELGMSQSQLNRKTTALVGISPNKFIRFIRLNNAKILLTDPSNNISSVAYQTGFNDPSYFGRVFKKQFNVTPLEWKESGKIQE